MQAPQPRRADYGRDTFFVGGEVATEGSAPVRETAPGSLLGYFDESQLPRPGGPSQMEGFNPITGVASAIDKTKKTIAMRFMVRSLNPRSRW